MVSLKARRRKADHRGKPAVRDGARTQPDVGKVRAEDDSSSTCAACCRRDTHRSREPGSTQQRSGKSGDVPTGPQTRPGPGHRHERGNNDRRHHAAAPPPRGGARRRHEKGRSSHKSRLHGREEDHGGQLPPSCSCSEDAVSTSPTSTSTSQPGSPEYREFCVKTKSIHRLFKAIHHLQHVSTQLLPPSIAKLSSTLSSSIKPAVPDERTARLIAENAGEWARRTVLILRTHYETLRESELQRLCVMDRQGWTASFEKARLWAKRSFGKRLSPDTSEKTKVLLHTIFSESGLPPSPPTSSSSHPPPSSTSSSSPSCPPPPPPPPRPPSSPSFPPRPPSSSSLPPRPPSSSSLPPHPPSSSSLPPPPLSSSSSSLPLHPLPPPPPSSLPPRPPPRSSLPSSSSSSLPPPPPPLLSSPPSPRTPPFSPSPPLPLLSLALTPPPLSPSLATPSLPLLSPAPVSPASSVGSSYESPPPPPEDIRRWEEMRRRDARRILTCSAPQLYRPKVFDPQATAGPPPPTTEARSRDDGSPLPRLRSQAAARNLRRPSQPRPPSPPPAFLGRWGEGHESESAPVSPHPRPDWEPPATRARHRPPPRPAGEFSEYFELLARLGRMPLEVPPDLPTPTPPDPPLEAQEWSWIQDDWEFWMYRIENEYMGLNYGRPN